MTKQYVLGVDGGNTKTHYALFDTQGNAACFIKAGTSSHQQIPGGYDGMGEELGKQICRLTHQYGLDMGDISYAVLGMAGVDVGKQYEEVVKRIGNIGLTHFTVSNDAFLGIKAGCEKGYGISSINGTGTSCAGIDKYGHRLQVGGCGDISGGDFGGSYIEAAVIGRVYNSLYRCGPQTLMKDMLFDVLEITDEKSLLDAVYDKINTKKIKGDAISRIAFLAAYEGDGPASELLRYIGLETARSVIGTHRHLDFDGEESIDIVMAGSIYVKGENPLLLDTFKKEVSKGIDCIVNFNLLEEPPVTGAVIWAMEELKGKVDEAIRRNIREQLLRMQNNCPG